MFIDTHCHIDELNEKEVIKYLENAQKNDVEKLIISGVDLESSKKVIDLSNKYSNIYCTIGIHPNNIANLPENYLFELEKMSKNSKVVGIGEIGLDYFYTKDNSVKQIEILEQQLLLAEKLKLPIVIHNRDADEDILRIIKKYSLKGVFHCFSSNLEFAKKIISLNYKLGIGGIITFKNSDLKNQIKEVEIKHIVLETDSPYLSPEPNRGQINESANIKFIAEKLSKIKNKTLEEIAIETTSNAKELFDFDN